VHAQSPVRRPSGRVTPHAPAVVAGLPPYTEGEGRRAGSRQVGEEEEAKADMKAGRRR